jgi:hypothetical protein
MAGIIENKTWTEAERLAEIDRLKVEYSKKKKETELNLYEMRRIRKQIDLVEDALIIHTLRRWQEPRREVLCA